jgi:stage V sporulation protein G
VKITDVKICIKNEEKLKAFVRVTLDDCFIIQDIKVIKGESGLFVSMPSRKQKDDTFKDIAHPIDFETRTMFTKEIIGAYCAAVSEETFLDHENLKIIIKVPSPPNREAGL